MAFVGHIALLEHSDAPRKRRQLSCDAQCLISGILLGLLMLLVQGCPAEPDQSKPPKAPTVHMSH